MKLVQPGVPILFDYRAMAAKRARAAAMARHGSDFAFGLCAEEIGARLAVINRGFKRCVDLFPGSPALADAVVAAVPGIAVERIDDEALAARGGSRDELRLEPASVDLVVSAFGLHRLNDLPGALGQLRRALKPDGLFIAALPGEATLAELRESMIAAESSLASGAGVRVDPFVEVRQAGALLQRAGFALPVADVAQQTVRYRDVASLVADLRANAATAAFAGRARPLPRGIRRRLEAEYRARHGDADGRLRASLEVVYLTGWAPDASQQQPLARGSAEISLEKYLKR